MMTHCCQRILQNDNQIHYLCYVFMKIQYAKFRWYIWMNLLINGNFEHINNNTAPWKLPSRKLPPEKFPPRKLPPMKITPYENTHLWKFPPLKFSSSENRPLENCPQKINPKKIVRYESYHHSREKLKLLPCSPYVVIKNKAWWPVWWSWVSWKCRYLFNLTWIVVFL